MATSDKMSAGSAFTYALGFRRVDPFQTMALYVSQCIYGIKQIIDTQ